MPGAITELHKKAADLHSKVPADWYARSIKENLLQRYWHLKRFEEIGKMIEPTKGKILDIGSADGTFTKVITEKSGANKVIGIDVLEKSVNYAKKRFARSKIISFQVADAHNLPFGNNTFDGIFCLETLEHIENPNIVINEIHRVLKDDGYAIVLVPSENFLFKYIVWPLWGLYRGKIWKGTHIQDLNAKELNTKMEEGGFNIKEHRKFLLGMLQAVKVTKK